MALVLYYYEKLYELVRIGNEFHICLKRRIPNDSLIYMVLYEEYYEKLLESHLQTGHGGRPESIIIQKKWKMYKEACA